MVEVVTSVIAQHVEDAAVLHAARSALTRAPHVKVHHLRRFDNRLEAHLDGLSVAGEHAWQILAATLDQPSPGRVFAATVRAIEDGRTGRVESLIALVDAVAGCRSGLFSAFGWLSAEQLRGVVVEMLRSQHSLKRLIGVAASAMHRVDPGLVSFRYIEDPEPAVRAYALRAAGEIGNQDVISLCVAAISDRDPDCQSWAAWSAVLLGNRGVGLEALTSEGLADGPHRIRAFPLALQATGLSAAHRILEDLATDPKRLRWLIQGAGIVGDPTYVPWLIGHMDKVETARLAGEAFSLITGLDLALLDLERKPPEDFESGPNDDPDDPNVEMDEDDGLPWPDFAADRKVVGVERSSDSKRARATSWARP